jgi:uncharacterized protein YceH (UPF0502 family)
MLAFEEARVLGSLMEKAVTTPEYYPLTFNALVAACNQKSNRQPVSELGDDTVDLGLDGLREKRMAALISVAGSRVPKYKHTIDQVFPQLGKAGFSLLCVLLLRGPQTLGELRTRTERMFAFDSLEDTQEALEALKNYPGGPLVKELAAGGGRRVPTFAHLLSGEVEDAGGGGYAVAPVVDSQPGWKAEMEAKYQVLRAEMDELKAAFEKFREQF